MKNHHWFLMCIGIALLAVSLACNFTSLSSVAGSDATAQALATSIADNATLAAEIASTPEIAQVQATATEAAPIASVTQEVQETGSAVEPGSTQTVPGNPGRAVAVWN